jgi:hypothetical protein
MTSPGFNDFLSHPQAAMNFGLEPPTVHFSMVPLPWTSSAIITCGLAQVNAVTVPCTVTRFDRSTGHSWCASNGLTATMVPITPNANFRSILIAPPPPRAVTGEALVQG